METASNGSQAELLSLMAPRRGHFRLESGHHGDLWLDLDAFFIRPGRSRPYALQLAARLSTHGIQGVCGPWIGGAFLAQTVAAELEVELYYAERISRSQKDGSVPVAYRVPDALRARARDRKIAIVDDVINAGSASRGTFIDLAACGARPVAIGALLTLGSGASRFAADMGIPLEGIAHLDNEIWRPSGCPLCASGTPLENLTELT